MSNDMIELTGTFEGITKAKLLLSHIEDGAPKAISAALNRTIDGVVTDVVREVPKEYIIRPSDVRAALKDGVVKSTTSTLRAGVTGKGRPINLINFRATPNKPGYQPQGTILRAQVKRSGGGGIPGAFVMNVDTKSGAEKVRIVKRAGDERFPLKGEYGPSVPQMMGEDNVQEAVMKGAAERFDKRIDHEIDRLLKKS